MTDLRQSLPLPASPRPIAVIGAGGIVRDAHLPAYRIAGFPVVAIADRDRNRAAAVATDFSIPRVCGSVEELVETAPPGAVFDCALPPGSIRETLEKLPDGAAVLIQKPFGTDLAEARILRDICRRKRLVAAVNFQLRFAPHMIAARDAVARGLIGDILDWEVRLSVDTPWNLWPGFKGLPRMEIPYHSIHYVDLARACLGEPRGVVARTLPDPRSPELASTRTDILPDYGDNLRATIGVNHAHRFGSHRQENFVKWEGTRGAIRATFGVLLDYPEGRPDTLEIALSEDGAYRWRTVPLAGDWFPHAFIGTMGSLMRFVSGETDTLPTSVEDAFRTMAVVEAAYRSHARGSEPIPE